MSTTLLELAARPLAPERSAVLLRSVAAAVHALHRRGRAHRHLAPRWVRLFGDEVSELDGADEGADWLAAHRGDELAYAAPELLQPTLHAVDHRADLYSVGALFYELLVGVPPFAAVDLLGWTHAHVAQAPRPPVDVRRAVPPPLSDIALKLLAKAADERYQSATGLIADLDRWLAAAGRGDGDSRFALGERDVPEHLRISQRLYGRDGELQLLEAASERVAHGAPELALVRGPSGIGKSALVHGLERRQTGQRGVFVAGKFDQYDRDIPYATLVKAFSELARQLLAASEERLTAWRQRLQSELGNLGQLIIDIIPQMELVIGPQPPVPPQPLLEAQNRFNRVLRQFIGVFAQPDQPLILFLDDLQWADAASIRLLQHILTHPDVEHVLVVCAYRDGEIGPSHPWTAALAEIQSADVRVSDVVVAPLPPVHVASLLVDTLRCSPEAAASLADLLHAKTAGNPFFVGQFLTMLANEGLLRLDPDLAAWRWDLAAIEAKGYTDNIVALMLERLQSLPAAAQRALSLLACAGAEIAPATLAALLGRDEAAVLADLAPALTDALVVARGGQLKFTHDRVQQAAYSLTDEAERAGVHLRIGRELRGPLGSDVAPERLFAVVNHLNAAAALIEGPAARLDLARLDVQAGRRAKQANAYSSALIYLNAALDLLPADAWDAHFQLTFDLHRDLSECAYLCNENDVAERLFDAAISHARDPLERAEIFALKISLYYSVGRMQESIDVGMLALRELGVDIPATPEARLSAFGPMIEAAVARFSALDIEALEHATSVADPARRVAASVLVGLLPSSFYLDIVLFSIIILRLVELSLVHGETRDSVVGYASFALLLVTVLGEHDMSGRIARMTLRRLEHITDMGVHAKVRTIYGWFTGPWHEPLPQILAHLRAGQQAGIEAGDLSAYGAFALLGQDTLLLCRGDSLTQVEEQWTRHRASYVQMQHEIAVMTTEVVLSQLPRLRGARVDVDDAVEPGPKVAGSALGTHHYLRMQRLYLLGDLPGAQQAADRFAATKGNGLLGTFLGTDGDFYCALVAAAVADREPVRRAEMLERVRVQAALSERLAGHCPANFRARAELLGAELLRLEGRSADALPRLEAAARAAAQDSFLAVEAIACERAGELARALGLGIAAVAYFERARSLYARWGASAKLAQLATRVPELGPITPPGSQWLSVDALAVVKATQALSGELMQDKLLSNLMHIVLEHAGAQNGHLLLLERERLVVAAGARTGDQGVEVTLPEPRPQVGGDGLALSIVQYVRRTREQVLLTDARTSPLFAADPHLAGGQVRSVLCVPIVRAGGLIGVLYLENNWMSGAFTPQRTAVLELLLAQAAISLTVSSLYGDLARENRERKQVEQGLRESEDRMRQLVESAGAIPWEADITVGRITYIGPQVEALLGHGGERFTGDATFLPGITHADDRDALELHLTASGGEARELEFRVRGQGGEELWLHSIRAARQARGEAHVRRGFFFDATARKRTEANLRDKLEIIAAQQEAIRQLSTPIIEVWEGVVLMPLFGTIDTGQAMRMQELLLDAIGRLRARFAIIDLTGVEVVDTGTAQHIIGLVRAVQLLGARGIVVGVRPDVASSIISLGVELGRISTLSTLREALLACMQAGVRRKAAT
ncbi:AAA family ATPase [Nannocystis sp. SCPEA4]|uniref:AAA family ATPase n=1 Tax=Nannocystis sp. SCPEA4 TaxID=2996787 RepID=UPI00226F77D9|nr:AAA family ATPase [Nannocystis sp. SCPEA4]MCY1058906.1 AAA family ATPase [Nannocystis sp. SCPEA4]